MANYEHITDDTSFDAYLAALKPNQPAATGASQTGAPGSGSITVAVDLEAEMNLHIYGEHFCLLQLFDGRRPAIVDPKTVSIDKIKAFLEDPSITKIFYDAASDRGLLYKNHGILIKPVLDLRPAVEILELEKQGLDSVLSDTLGLEPVAGKSRYQRYDWTRRPIRRDAVEYALRDVLYLFALRDELLLRLEAAGKTEEFVVENARREAIVPDLDRKPGMFRTRRFEKMSAEAKEEFERIYTIRESYAKRLNIPSHMVLDKNQLFELAAGKADAKHLERPPRVPAAVFAALRSEIIESDVL